MSSKNNIPTDVNDGNFYLSRARCNRRTLVLNPDSATSHTAVTNLNGKITQVVVDYSSLIPLQSGSGVGHFQIFSDVQRVHNTNLIPYHKPIDDIDLTLTQDQSILVLDVTPGSDQQDRGIFPVFFNMVSDGAGQPVLTTEAQNTAIGKTSWNGLVHGDVKFSFTLTGSTPLPADGQGVKITIYLE